MTDKPWSDPTSNPAGDLRRYFTIERALHDCSIGVDVSKDGVTTVVLARRADDGTIAMVADRYGLDPDDLRGTADRRAEALARMEQAMHDLGRNLAAVGVTFRRAARNIDDLAVRTKRGRRGLAAQRSPYGPQTVRR